MFIEKNITTTAIDLLKQLIQTPSFSKEEKTTADIIQNFFKEHQIKTFRKNNNVWAKSKYWSNDKPTVLLNSHHDTVKPVSSWTLDPFEARCIDDRIYGLGSNDAGASLVSLIATFITLFEKSEMPFNLVIAATAEEEISGKKGIASIIDQLPAIDFAIVGEPTQMQMAIAEKGLMVIDALAKGVSGHAARDEGLNAILIAMQDIQKIKTLQFQKSSKWLGDVKCSVTQIQAGTQHNVVPDTCQFVIDVRTTDAYSNEAVFNLLDGQLQSNLTARSFRLQPSGVDESHPIISKGKELGLQCFGSPTLSDQALIPFPSVKIGPGDSARSHTANEFIKINEIKEAIKIYKGLLGR